MQCTLWFSMHCTTLQLIALQHGNIFHTTLHCFTFSRALYHIVAGPWHKVDKVLQQISSGEKGFCHWTKSKENDKLVLKHCNVSKYTIGFKWFNDDLYFKLISRNRNTGLNDISYGRHQIKYLIVDGQVYITTPIILQVTSDQRCVSWPSLGRGLIICGITTL